VIDELADPLIHLVRNSVDHGIELPAVRQKQGKPPAGLVSINARPDENQILVELRDDGRGIDVARVRDVAVSRGLMTADAAQRTADADLLDLIFLPGFSTAERITEVSGRGVGMDIVRSRIERVNGSVTVSSVPGEGTSFVIRLPLTLAIIRGLLVTLRQQPYAIPLTVVAEVLRIPREDVRSVGRRPAIELRGEILPLVWLEELLAIPPRDGEDPNLVAVSVRLAGRRVGIVVDGLIGEQDVVIKPIGAFLGKARGIAGATILVDGRVCPILNVAGLLAASSVAISRSDESEAAAISQEGRS
jgi:two-component system chemotaxis sensor kinase CheA